MRKKFSREEFDRICDKIIIANRKSHFPGKYGSALSHVREELGFSVDDIRPLKFHFEVVKKVVDGDRKSAYEFYENLLIDLELAVL